MENGKKEEETPLIDEIKAKELIDNAESALITFCKAMLPNDLFFDLEPILRQDFLERVKSAEKEVPLTEFPEVFAQFALLTKTEETINFLGHCVSKSINEVEERHDRR